MRRIFGVLFILGGAACAFVAYLEGGGIQGPEEFIFRLPDKLLEGDVLLFSAGTVVLLVVGIGQLVGRLKAAKASDVR